jgi:hypothetical protein
MANDVFANGREISCKAGSGKSICAVPDVCFTPPENPATPPGVPVPYPNTGMASDTTSGSKKVKISGKEIMLRNRSYFKKSIGDEAGCAAKKGIVTSVHRGKIYFTAWSMDVKAEGQNVVRHLDMTTHNHASFPSNTGPWPYLDMAAVEPGGVCHTDHQKAERACAGVEDPCKVLGDKKPKQKKRSEEAEFLADEAAADFCVAARRCLLQPYKPSGCCYPQTGHHLVEASSFFETGRGKKGDIPLAGVNTGSVPYNEDDAPCVCAEGTFQHNGTHGLMHTFQSAANASAPNGKTTFKGAKQNGIAAARKVFPESGCNPDCLEKQLDNYHNQCGVNDSTEVKAVVTGDISPEALARAEEVVAQRTEQIMNQRLENMAEGLADMAGIPSFPFR